MNYEMPSKKTVERSETAATPAPAPLTVPTPTYELPHHALGMPEVTEMEDVLENAPEVERILSEEPPVTYVPAPPALIVLPDPKHVISLASSGMLVCVETHVYTGITQNKEESAKVTANNKAAKDAAKVVQNLFSHSAEHKAIIDYRTRIYNWSQSIGYDWAGKMRYIPALVRQQFQDEYAVHKKEFDRLADEFVAAYEILVTQAAFTQGDMFNRAAYPLKAGMRQRFSCDMFPMPIPANDFREELFKESAAELKSFYEKQAARIVHDMTMDATGRLMELMSQISNACTDRSNMTDANGKKARSAKVYETTVDKAKAIGAIVRSINIIGDPELEEAARRFDAVMSKVSFNALRESPLTRHETKEEVDKLLPLLSKFAPLEGGY